jgi:hypothetical protein
VIVNGSDRSTSADEREIAAIEQKLLAEAHYGPVDFKRGICNERRQRVA